MKTTMKSGIFWVIVCAIFFGIYIVIANISNAKEQHSINAVNGDTDGTSLITLTINGKSHEFVMYKRGIGETRTMGISHWPECQYCKHDSVDFSGYNANGDSDLGI